MKIIYFETQMESLMFWGKFMNAKFRYNIITFLKRKANLVIHMFW